MVTAVRVPRGLGLADAGVLWGSPRLRPSPPRLLVRTPPAPWCQLTVNARSGQQRSAAGQDRRPIRSNVVACLWKLRCQGQPWPPEFFRGWVATDWVSRGRRAGSGTCCHGLSRTRRLNVQSGHCEFGGRAGTRVGCGGAVGRAVLMGEGALQGGGHTTLCLNPQP